MKSALDAETEEAFACFPLLTDDGEYDQTIAQVEVQDINEFSPTISGVPPRIDVEENVFIIISTLNKLYIEL